MVGVYMQPLSKPRSASLLRGAFHGVFVCLFVGVAEVL